MTTDNGNERKRRGGRPATGTLVKTRGGRWQALITLADGSRKRWPRGGFPAGTSEAYAREKAAFWAAEAREKGIVRKAPVRPAPVVAEPTDDGMAEWVETWLADRRARGQGASTDESQYRNHVAPVLPHHVRDWTAEELRRLVADLDGKAQRHIIRPKTASNVWMTARAMCRDASRSKVEELRVRADNPATDVLGPDKGPTREKQFLYPNEFLKLMRCDAVPLAYRRLVALACYTFTRAGELRVLRWEDVDLVHGVMLIHRAWDHDTKREKSTKGRAARRIPIHSNLRPLLEVLNEETGGEGRVLPAMPGKADMSTDLREHLTVAGVERSDLYTDTETTRHIVFHDLKGAACTWAAVAGTPPLTIMQRAAHQRVDTTMLYVRLAEVVSGAGSFGEPFPELPACLLSPANATSVGSKRTRQTHARRQRRRIAQSNRVASLGVEPNRITVHPVRAPLPGDLFDGTCDVGTLNMDVCLGKSFGRELRPDRLCCWTHELPGVAAGSTNSADGMGAGGVKTSAPIAA